MVFKVIEETKFPFDECIGKCLFLPRPETQEFEAGNHF